MKRHKIAVVGNRSFPITAQLGSEIVNVLRAYPPQTFILTRGSEGLDTFILKVCEIVGMDTVIYSSAGGAANYLRDVQMVADADEVIVFLDPQTLDDENTGTAHVLTKALDQKKPVAAWTTHNDHLVYAGSSL